MHVFPMQTLYKLFMAIHTLIDGLMQYFFIQSYHWCFNEIPIIR